jgi:hypothetical protein
LAEGDAASALDELQHVRDTDTPGPPFALVEAHLLAGIAHLNLGDRSAAAAAAEAARIGGTPGDRVTDDPAMEPVYEAGGGDAEGFELAETELIENASHGDGHGDPSQDAFTPEAESDAATALSGEPDEEKVSEVVEDPAAGVEDDPGRGPGITHER